MDDAVRKAILDAKQAQALLEEEKRARSQLCQHAIQALLDLHQCEIHVDEMYRDGQCIQRMVIVTAKPLTVPPNVEVGNPAPEAQPEAAQTDGMKGSP